jgi:nucleoside-diphosphate-sugar epimerase
VRILLSGATGLVGGALAGRLLDDGHQLYALVRGMGRQILDLNGRNRIDDVTALQGDIVLPLWGMDALPDSIDLVIHCAATTDFAASPEVYASINIGGAEAAIAIAKALDAALLHVSTAYVCGQADGPVAEIPADLSRNFTNGYERSKAQAEMRVMAAMRGGLTAAIARPSIITGQLKDGSIPRQDDFYNLFRLFGSPLLGKVPAAHGAAFALVPICHVIAGLSAMAEDMNIFAGDAVHLVAAKPYPLSDMLALVAEYPGASAAQIVNPDDYDPATLDRRQAMVHRKVGAQFFDYFLRTPLFASDILREKAGICAPEIDRAALRRMADYCHETGFLDWR